MIKSRKKKQVLDEHVMNRPADKVGYLSNAIRESNFPWTDKLSKCVYRHLGYDDAVGPKVTLSGLWVLMITKHIKAIWY